MYIITTFVCFTLYFTYNSVSRGNLEARNLVLKHSLLHSEFSFLTFRRNLELSGFDYQNKYKKKRNTKKSSH